RCSRALVPTVVPCRSVSAAESLALFEAAPIFVVAAPIFLNASAIARDGSSGVENTLRVLRAPSSTQTQSVNVPPVSMAMRNARVARTLLSAAFDLDVASGRSAEWSAECGARAMISEMTNKEDYHRARPAQ